MVDCEDCGASNDDKLTFCRNCGSRLKKRQTARAAAPAAKQARSGDPSDAPATRRPSAPQLVLGPAAARTDVARVVPSDVVPSAVVPSAVVPSAVVPSDPAPPAPPAPPAQAEPAGSAADDALDGRIRCEQCGVQSPKGYRFCVGCGAVLPRKQREVVPAVLANAMLKSRRASVRPPAPEEPKAEAPKQKSAAPQQEGDEKTVARAVRCEKCGGKCEGGEAFCKYCGSPLPRADKSKAPKNGDAATAKNAEPAPSGPPPRVSSTTDAPPPAEKRAERAKRSAQPRDEGATGAREAVDAVPNDGQRRHVPTKQPVDTDTGATGRLVVIVEDGSEGAAIDLRGSQMDVGSAEGDIVLAEDRYLSPRHARLFRQEDAWYLRDLGSLNGVYRRLRKPTTLRNGDLVLLGLEVLQFELVEHAEQGLGHAVQHGVLLFGSPAAVRRARLCQRTVEGIVRDVYHLVGDETTIGREIGDLVFTSDPFMSRRHASLKWQEPSQEYVLSDLSSSNGTYLAIREDVRLENGDFIRLGQHLFRVDLQPSGGAARGGGKGW